MARRVIQRHGRDVTAVKQSRTPADPDHPYKGPSPTAVTTASIRAAFVDAGRWGYTASEIEDLVRRGVKVALVAGIGAPADLETYDRILDGTASWRIHKVRRLSPGGTTLLYQLEVGGVP